MAKAKAKEKSEYQIIKKRSGRFAVKNAKGQYINGKEKVDILLKEKKIKLSAPKKKAAEDKKEE